MNKRVLLLLITSLVIFAAYSSAATKEDEIKSRINIITTASSEGNKINFDNIAFAWMADNGIAVGADGIPYGFQMPGGGCQGDVLAKAKKVLLLDFAALTLDYAIFNSGDETLKKYQQGLLARINWCKANCGMSHSANDQKCGSAGDRPCGDVGSEKLGVALTIFADTPSLDKSLMQDLKNIKDPSIRPYTEWEAECTESYITLSANQKDGSKDKILQYHAGELATSPPACSSITSVKANKPYSIVSYSQCDRPDRFRIKLQKADSTVLSFSQLLLGFKGLVPEAPIQIVATKSKVEVKTGGGTENKDNTIEFYKINKKGSESYVKETGGCGSKEEYDIINISALHISHLQVKPGKEEGSYRIIAESSKNDPKQDYAAKEVSVKIKKIDEKNQEIVAAEFITDFKEGTRDYTFRYKDKLYYYEDITPNAGIVFLPEFEKKKGKIAIRSSKGKIRILNANDGTVLCEKNAGAEITFNIDDPCTETSGGKTLVQPNQDYDAGEGLVVKAKDQPVAVFDNAAEYDAYITANPGEPALLWAQGEGGARILRSQGVLSYTFLDTTVETQTQETQTTMFVDSVTIQTLSVYGGSAANPAIAKVSKSGKALIITETGNCIINVKQERSTKLQEELTSLLMIRGTKPNGNGGRDCESGDVETMHMIGPGGSYVSCSTSGNNCVSSSEFTEQESSYIQGLLGYGTQVQNQATAMIDMIDLLISQMGSLAAFGGHPPETAGEYASAFAEHTLTLYLERPLPDDWEAAQAYYQDSVGALRNLEGMLKKGTSPDSALETYAKYTDSTAQSYLLLKLIDKNGKAYPKQALDAAAKILELAYKQKNWWRFDHISDFIFVHYYATMQLAENMAKETSVATPQGTRSFNIDTTGKPSLASNLNIWGLLGPTMGADYKVPQTEVFDARTQPAWLSSQYWATSDNHIGSESELLDKLERLIKMKYEEHLNIKKFMGQDIELVTDAQVYCLPVTEIEANGKERTLASNPAFWQKVEQSLADSQWREKCDEGAKEVGGNSRFPAFPLNDGTKMEIMGSKGTENLLKVKKEYDQIKIVESAVPILKTVNEKYREAEKIQQTQEILSFAGTFIDPFLVAGVTFKVAKVALRLTKGVLVLKGVGQEARIIRYIDFATGSPIRKLLGQEAAKTSRQALRERGIREVTTCSLCLTRDASEVAKSRAGPKTEKMMKGLEKKADDAAEQARQAEKPPAGVGREGTTSARQLRLNVISGNIDKRVVASSISEGDLIHGTSTTKLQNILKTGYIEPSEIGTLGSGVYVARAYKDTSGAVGLAMSYATGTAKATTGRPVLIRIVGKEGLQKTGFETVIKGGRVPIKNLEIWDPVLNKWIPATNYVIP